LKKEKQIEFTIDKLQSYQSNIDEDDPEQIWSEEATPFTDLLLQLSAPDAASDQRILHIASTLLRSANWPAEALESATPEMLLQWAKIVVFASAQEEQGLSWGSEDEEDDEEGEEGDEGEEDGEDQEESAEGDEDSADAPNL
jgi:hypothetical protein